MGVKIQEPVKQALAPLFVLWFSVMVMAIGYMIMIMACLDLFGLVLMVPMRNNLVHEQHTEYAQEKKCLYVLIFPHLIQR